MNDEVLLRKTISLLRFPIGVAVIFVHSYGGNVDVQSMNFFALSGHDVYDIIRVLFSQIITTIASPFFFLISGYFYFKSIDQLNPEVYKSKTLNRVKTLLIPYLAWNFLAFFVPIVTSLMKGDFESSISMLKDFSFYDIFWIFKTWGYGTEANLLGLDVYLSGPRNIPLWFLRELFVMSLLAPVIWFIVKKTRISGVIFLGICYVTRTWVSTPGFNIAAIFFFTLGAWMSINKLNLVTAFRPYRVPVYILTGIVLVADLFTMGLQIQVLFIHQLFKFLGLFSVLIAASYMVEKQIINVSSHNVFIRSAFFIYVAHSVSIHGIVMKVYDHFFMPESPLLLTLKYFAVPITTTIACILSYMILMKLIPGILKAITGGLR